MTEHHLAPGMSRREILQQLLHVEAEAQALLTEAAHHIAADAEERHLYERLAARESQALAALHAEQDRLEAEDFVQRAMDV